jgi:tetratricopeptide (TPR) repeat protein
MKKTDYAASQVLYKQPGNADALLVRMAAFGFIARLNADRDQWVKSIKAAHKAYKVYGVLKKSMPNFPDTKMIDGLKLYYSAYLPKAYPVVKALAVFMPKGNESKGLKYLKEASQNAIFVRAEATYFLGDIYYNYRQNYPKAVYYFKKLYRAYPRNNYYTRLLVRSEYKMGMYDEALNVINTSLKRWNEHNYPFHKILKEDLLFWKARIFYRDGKYDQALPLFMQSLQVSNNLPRSQHRQNYVKAAYYAGVISAKKGNKKKAIQYFKDAANSKTAPNYRNEAKKKLAELQAG